MFGIPSVFTSGVLWGLILVTLSVAFLWYYWYFLAPYAMFPNFRMEHLISYWLLTRKHINNEVFKEFVRQSKRFEAEGLYVSWIGRPLLIVYGEEIVKAIVQEPAAVDRPFFYKMFEFFIGKGLLTSDGECWRSQRRSLAPSFHVNALKMHTPVINKNAEDLVKQLLETNGKPTDEIARLLSECSLSIIYESSLGVKERNPKEITRVVEINQKVADFLIYRSWSPWLHSDFALCLFPSAKKIVRMAKEVRKIYRTILENIQESVIARNSSPATTDDDSGSYGKKPKSFGEITIEEHLKNPSFSMEELELQISILIGAGFDTTAHALMWCIFLLGLHQDIQDRVYVEVATLTEDYVEYKDLHDLNFLECVIKETLRLYSVIPAFGRHLNKDLKCGKYLVPKNTDILVLPCTLHRNPDIYPNPEKFDPDRFMAKPSKIKPWNFIPFAEGARPCIGKNFSMIEIKIIIVHLLRNFKIVSLDRREDVGVKWSIVLESDKKLRMQFLPRLLPGH